MVNAISKVCFFVINIVVQKSVSRNKVASQAKIYAELVHVVVGQPPNKR